MEIVTSWMKAGIRQGRLKGRQEGRREAGFGFVLRQLGHRFGEIGVRSTSRIRKLPVTKVEALAEALLDFDSAGNVAQWLDANQPTGARKRASTRTSRF